MKIKTMLTILVALAFCAAPAFAAPGGPAHKEKQRIERKAAQANKVCRDRRLGPKTRSKQICKLYGICNPAVSCSQAVRQWEDRAKRDLMKRHVGKPVPPPKVGKPLPPPPPPKMGKPIPPPPYHPPR